MPIFFADSYNGRASSITPDYPNGVYAYYLPLDSSLLPTVPFIIGPKYYGTPQATVITSIPSSATVYFSSNLTNTYCSTSVSIIRTRLSGKHALMIAAFVLLCLDF